MESIILKSIKYCMDFLIKSRCQALPFHDVQHTLEVFNNVKIIGKNQFISEKDLEPVLIAALFHDTGVAKAHKNHEEISCVNAINFLISNGYPEEKINIVVGCIKATQIPQNPKTVLEAILCDADLFHLSGRYFELKNSLLRKEWEIHLNLKFSDKEWYLLNIDFLQQHKYQTPFGQTVLNEKKQKNISIFAKNH